MAVYIEDLEKKEAQELEKKINREISDYVRDCCYVEYEGNFRNGGTPGALYKVQRASPYFDYALNKVVLAIDGVHRLKAWSHKCLAEEEIKEEGKLGEELVRLSEEIKLIDLFELLEGRDFYEFEC